MLRQRRPVKEIGFGTQPTHIWLGAGQPIQQGLFRQRLTLCQLPPGCADWAGALQAPSLLSNLRGDCGEIDGKEALAHRHFGRIGTIQRADQCVEFGLSKDIISPDVTHLDQVHVGLPGPKGCQFAALDGQADQARILVEAVGHPRDFGQSMGLAAAPTEQFLRQPGRSFAAVASGQHCGRKGHVQTAMAAEFVPVIHAVVVQQLENRTHVAKGIAPGGQIGLKDTVRLRVVLIGRSRPDRLMEGWVKGRAVIERMVGQLLDDLGLKKGSKLLGVLCRDPVTRPVWLPVHFGRNHQHHRSHDTGVEQIADPVIPGIVVDDFTERWFSS